MKVLSLCVVLVASASLSWGAIMRRKQDQSGENKAATLVRKLQSDREGERAHAKKGLRSLVRASAQSREQVIRELVKLVGDSELVLRVSSTAHYDAWSFAAELLGEVKAVEALDVLIACINCNNGLHGLSSYRYPAFRALIMIGPEAVPKLTEALSNSSVSTRARAASALGEIGGAEAKKALEQALIAERDEDVVRSIKIALRKH